MRWEHVSIDYYHCLFGILTISMNEFVQKVALGISVGPYGLLNIWIY